jgi:hypothetical protein
MCLIERSMIVKKQWITSLIYYIDAHEHCFYPHSDDINSLKKRGEWEYMQISFQCELTSVD